MNNTIIVITNLGIIFAMILVGFVSGRFRLFSDRAQADFTTFVLKVSLPCTIISSMVREFDSTLLIDSVIIFFIGMIFFGGGMIIMTKVAPLMHVRPGRQKVWGVLCAISNTGFMGFPLVKAVYGDSGLFLAAMMNTGFNIVVWSIGVKLIASENDSEGTTNWRKILMTNMNYAVVLGLILFIGQIQIPDTIMTIVNYFGNITTPMSMFLIGLGLAQGKVTDAFRDKDVLSSTFMRLIVVPLVSLVILKLLPLDELTTNVACIVIAMPCASASMMISQDHGGDTIMAARTIFLTSLLCIVTIPLIMMLL